MRSFLTHLNVFLQPLKVKGHLSKSIIIHWCLPVNAQSTEAQHCDPHWGLLHKWHQLAQRHTERPILCQQLRKRHLLDIYWRFKSLLDENLPLCCFLSHYILGMYEPKFTLSESIPSSYSPPHVQCFLPFMYFFKFYLKEPWTRVWWWVIKNSITLLNLDRPARLISALNKWNASLDQLGSYVVLHKSLVYPLWYATMSSCFSMLAPLPKYTAPPTPHNAHMHTQNQTDNEIPET